jgi:hypothetical protein
MVTSVTTASINNTTVNPTTNNSVGEAPGLAVPTEPVINYGAIGRLARILAEIARSPQSSVALDPKADGIAVQNRA